MNASKLSLGAAAAVVLIAGLMGVCSADEDIYINARIQESVSIVSCPDAIPEWNLVAGTDEVFPDVGEGQTLDDLSLGSNTNWVCTAVTDNATMNSHSTGDALAAAMQMKVGEGAYTEIGTVATQVATGANLGQATALPISFRQPVGWADNAHSDYKIQVTIAVATV